MRPHLGIWIGLFALAGIVTLAMKYYAYFPGDVSVIVDTEGKDVLIVNNRDLYHSHGACNPVMALDEKSVDAMVVGGIGAGAIAKLNSVGVKVYQAGAPTVKENLSLLSEKISYRSYPSFMHAGLTRANAGINGIVKTSKRADDAQSWPPLARRDIEQRGM